jgi:hypothetical protein
MNIFVFGSNRQGIHRKGAALTAKRSHGAIDGQPHGWQGNSFAIVTKELRKGKWPPVTLPEIAGGVESLFNFANLHPTWTFTLTPIGCGLAGFTPEQIAPLFKDAPKNILLPVEFASILGYTPEPKTIHTDKLFRKKRQLSGKHSKPNKPIE